MRKTSLSINIKRKDLTNKQKEILLMYMLADSDSFPWSYNEKKEIYNITMDLDFYQTEWTKRD